VKTLFGAAMAALIIALCWSSLAAADGSGDPAAVKDEDGKYFDKEGNPTYKVQADGTVDWHTYSGFLAVVAGGRRNVNSAQENVMPAFGTNANVMCYLDDIFVYLRARADDAVGRGRPEKHAEKPAAASAAEDTCFGAKH
jgi:hypothetical protein